MFVGSAGVVELVMAGRMHCAFGVVYMLLTVVC